MARGSYQNEIPASRVNIKYVKYVGDAQEETELPLKLLILGDFTQRDDNTPLEDRKRININKNNFASVMKEQQLKLNLTVDDLLSGEEDSQMKVNLDIQGLKDFLPENIAKQVPELRMLLEVRQLLQDLKGKVVNNTQFRRELERVLHDKDQMKALKEHLDQIAPLLQPVKEEPES